jgi:hypothetical protein
VAAQAVRDVSEPKCLHVDVLQCCNDNVNF